MIPSFFVNSLRVSRFFIVLLSSKNVLYNIKILFQLDPIGSWYMNKENFPLYNINIDYQVSYNVGSILPRGNEIFIILILLFWCRFKADYLSLENRFSKDSILHHKYIVFCMCLKLSFHRQTFRIKINFNSITWYFSLNHKTARALSSILIINWNGKNLFEWCNLCLQKFFAGNHVLKCWERNKLSIYKSLEKHVSANNQH